MSILKVISTKTSVRSEFYTYVELMENRSIVELNEMLETWYEPRKNGELKLVCGCSSENVPMKITCREGNYFLSSYPNYSGIHAKDCPFFNSSRYQSSNLYEPNILTDEENNVHLTLKKNVINVQQPKKKTDKKSYDSDKMRNRKWNLSDEDSIHQDYITVYAMTRLLLMDSWKICVNSVLTKSHTYPTLRTVYETIYQFLAKTHYIHAGKSINKSIRLIDIMYTMGKVGAFHAIGKKHKFKYNVYFIAEYDSHQFGKDIEGHDPEMSLLHVNKIIGTDDEKQLSFTVPTSVLKAALSSNRVQGGPLLVGGFASKNGGFKVLPHISSLAFVPVSKNGVVVESSYERQFYDRVCEEKRIVWRIYKPSMFKKYKPWNGFNPDGVFIDTEIPTIVEVFGISEGESKKDYHEQRRNKIDHFSNLKPEYDFWKWDAYKRNEAIPPFPRKKGD